MRNNVFFSTIILIFFYFKVFENVRLKCFSLICFHSELNSIPYFSLLFQICVFRHYGCDQDMKTFSERFCLSFPIPCSNTAMAARAGTIKTCRQVLCLCWPLTARGFPGSRGVMACLGEHRKSRLSVLLKTTSKSVSHIS